MINRNAQIVGLIFDGNIHSLGGDYGFDPSVNRTVAVHPPAISGARSRTVRAGRGGGGGGPPPAGGAGAAAREPGT